MNWEKVQEVQEDSVPQAENDFTEMTETLYTLFKECTGICTDTRKITEGVMFFALKGDNFDGNDFALKALELGAKYAVVDRPSLQGVVYNKTHKCILVEDVLQSLQQLAAYHRSLFDIPVLGITGTNGKTTTKELIATVLSKKYNVLYTQGNFNNGIGVPLTLLGLSPKHQFAVIEMGASAPGEIKDLVRIVKPTCGVVTNVGKAHLLGFGSFEGVMRAKGELYDHLRQTGGPIFYNADNPSLKRMVSMRPGLVARPYGMTVQNATVEKPSAENPFLSLKLNDGSIVSTKLIGRYNADNVLCALFIAEFFKVSVNMAIRAIEDYTPSNNRSQFLRTDRNGVIVDAYNANPTSMDAAISSFKEIDFPDKAIILGDMLELGESSDEEHIKVLQKAYGITHNILTVGENFAAATSELNLTEKIRNFLTADALKEYLEHSPLKGNTILVKGSNGTHLQSITGSL